MQFQVHHSQILISKFLNQVTTLTHDVLEELKSESSGKSDLDSIKSSLISSQQDQYAQESKEIAGKAADLLDELETLKE